MTTTVWITIGGLCVVTAVIKAFGPLVFGGRRLPGEIGQVIPLLAPALLAALVITETFGHGRSLVVDARAGGVVTAAVALAARAPLAVVVLSAAVVTALLRALG
jgi:branched-subunit amino acid transport protein